MTRTCWQSPGVEADYDGGTLGFDDAVMIAEKAGLAALLYTSPSHSPTAPRWRVLCPASGPLAPGMRDRLMARLNGLYGGVFADESWALSQSYFFGRVNDAQPPQTAIVEGAPIDELDELDHIARGKPDTINPAGNGGNGAQRGPLDEQALLEAIIGGTDFHRACVRLLGRWAQRGMPMMEAQQRLVTAFECVMPPDRDQRWRTRFNDIPRCVLGIYDKEAGKQDNVVEFKISSTSTGANATPETDQQIPPQDAEAVDDADDIKLYDASDLSKEALPPREWLLGNVFCRQFLSSLLGSGGVGKTAIRILQALAVATGRNLTDEHVHQRCPVLFLSFEDGVLELKRRVRAAMLHHHISDDEVRGWFKYATITGHKLAETDRRQKIVPGDLPHWLRATIRKTGAGLVVFDPFIKTHGVSENDNSAMDQVCAMLADLAVELNFAGATPHSQGCRRAG